MMVAIAEMERVPRGEIIVGANEGTCLHILPYVFADFKKQYPDVSVNIKRADYAKILESIIDNSVDFGVVSLPVTDHAADGGTDSSRRTDSDCAAAASAGQDEIGGHC